MPKKHAPHPAIFVDEKLAQLNWRRSFAFLSLSFCCSDASLVGKAILLSVIGSQLLDQKPHLHMALAFLLSVYKKIRFTINRTSYIFDEHDRMMMPAHEMVHVFITGM